MRRRRLYYNLACKNRARLAIAPPKGKYAQFLFDKRRESGQNVAAYARTLDIGDKALRGQLKGRLPSPDTYARLQRFFGDELPFSQTSDEAMREKRRTTGKQNVSLMRTPEARKKAGQTMRGRKHSEERVKNMVASMPAGHYERLAEAARRYSQSPQGRAERSLAGRLRSNPRPTIAVLKGWAEDVGDRIGMPAGSVLFIWEEWMDRHGMATSKRGRRSLEDRHQLVVELMERRSATASGRAPRGFWAEAAQLVNDAEGSDVDGTWLKEWYKQHRKHCADQALLVRGYNSAQAA